MGSGRTGFSTGAGPVGYYTSVGGSRRRTSSSSGTGPSRSTIAAQQRQLAKAQKMEQATALAEAIKDLMAVHHASFSCTTPPSIEAIEPPPLAKFRAEHRAAALKGISIFRRSERRAAKAAADLSAAEAHDRASSDASIQTQNRRMEADRWWSRLLHNEPDVVLALLEEAYEDNEVPAAAVGVDGAEVSLVTLAPSIEIVPERMPSVTDAGNISLKKMAKRDRVSIYNEFVAGCLLVALKEAFAVAPGIQSARVAVLRDDGPDAYGKPALVCLIAGRWTRQALTGVEWTTEATRILTDTSVDLLVRAKGQAKELQPLDLAQEPDIEQLVRLTDFS